MTANTENLPLAAEPSAHQGPVMGVGSGALFASVLSGDCLQVMATMEAGSIDAIISDPPYGTTYAPWDCDVPLPELWIAWKRVLKPGGAIVLTASQPFTSALVMSNLRWFRCEWIWDKVNAANFANAKRQPMKTHESVLVFGERQTTYNPQKVLGAKNHVQGASTVNASETRLINGRVADDLSGMKYPKSIQTFAKHSSQCGLHPTQKPVDLMRYLVRTYTNPGEMVLDCFAGSGTTGVAAKAEGRNCVLIEREEKYLETARQRLLANAGCEPHEGSPSAPKN